MATPSIIVLGGGGAGADTDDPWARRRALGFSTALGAGVTAAATKHLADGVAAYHPGAGKMVQRLIVPMALAGGAAGYADRSASIQRAKVKAEERAARQAEAVGSSRRKANVVVVDTTAPSGVDGVSALRASHAPDGATFGKLASIHVGTLRGLPLQSLRSLRAEYPGRSDAELMLMQAYANQFAMQDYRDDMGHARAHGGGGGGGGGSVGLEHVRGEDPPAEKAGSYLGAKMNTRTASAIRHLRQGYKAAADMPSGPAAPVTPIVADRPPVTLASEALPAFQQQLPNNLRGVEGAFETYRAFERQFEEQIKAFNNVPEHRNRATVVLPGGTQLSGLTVGSGGLRPPSERRAG